LFLSSEPSQIFKDVMMRYPHTPPDAKERIPTRKPQFEHPAEKATDIKATWLGHACFLVEMPYEVGSKQERGPRILFDPVFSDVCFSVDFMGPRRYTRK
jgi:N-acyl-phosphatidylethanolamine-hydrolysing phospholipase D